jgi:hypothetical protein
MTPPQPDPPFVLSNLIGVRPPWAWRNLDSDEADVLDECLDEFVDHYNATMALRRDQIIPLCWRQHPYMGQVLPVLFFGWVASHRDQDAHVVAALEWHRTHLRAFHERLTDYLGTNATSCQSGKHTDTGNHELKQALAAQELNRGDLSVRGPIITSNLRTLDFGAGA